MRYDIILLMLVVTMTVASIGSFILGLLNRHTIEEVKDHTNGMLKKLETAAGAAGNLQGRADERREHPRPSELGEKPFPPGSIRP